MKSNTTLSKAKQFREMLEFLDEVYVANKNSNNYENNRILRNFSRWNMIVTKFVMIMFGNSFALVIISPWVMYLLTGNLEPALPIHLIFVDEKTVSGFMIHYTYMFFVLTTAYFGTAAVELLTIILTIHILPLVSIFDQAIKAVNVETTGRRKEAIKNSTWLHKSFRNLVLMHVKIHL